MSDGERRKVWVIGDSGECSHPEERISFVGDDGLNNYYGCGGCGAVLVSPEEIVWMADAQSVREE